MEVTLSWRGGPTERIEVTADQTVLSAAEDAGLGLPFGCRAGACGTCTAKLLTGEVCHRRPTRALKDRHREGGYVFPCIAVPEIDCHLDVGASVQADLVSNPWR